jgi:predicted permease
VATMLFTALLILATGIGFGLLPALRATSSRGGAAAVRGGRTGRSVGHQRVSSALIVGEIALAVLLTVGAELLARSFADIRQLDPGFRADHLITARVNPPPASYRDAAKLGALYSAILSRTAALPGVEHVAAVSALPIAQPVYGGAWRIEGQFEDIKHNLPMMDHSQVVSDDYFATMRIPIVRGRAFTNADGSQPVAIVSQSAARHFWPGQDAIGKRIGHPWASPWLTVVGVAADIHTDSLRDTSSMSVYMPFRQEFTGYGNFTIVVRTTADPANIAHALRDVVNGIDRSVPLSEVRTMDDVIAGSLTNARFVTTLVGAFAMVALVLGAVGIYGVMSYLVSQRTHELGVRIALGATSQDVVGLVIRRAALLSLLGAAAGVALGFAAVRPLRAMLFGVSVTDPTTYVGVPALFILVALAACLSPALRAARVSPLRALGGSQQ